MKEPCLVEGCDRFAHMARGRVINGLCRGHREQKRRGEELRPLDEKKAGRLSLWESVLVAAERYSNADSDAAYRATRRTWQEASIRFAVKALQTRGFVVKRRKT